MLTASSPPKSPVKTTGPNVFAFKNVSYTVQKGKKTILHNVCGEAKSGELLSILGPSGAGKTTLLNALTLTDCGGKSFGEVTLNGVAFTNKMFSDYACFVTQEIKLWAFLTVRETCAFAAALYMTADAAERKKRVDEMIQAMGLTGCADTLVGNDFIKGLSGGQKRRLSVGMDLLKDPLLVFLDEPTSGLDAAAAAGIVSFLSKLAKEKNICMISTIHAPSTRVFLGFDKVLFLADGRVAYRGNPNDTIAYTKSIGQSPTNTNVNPAEHFLELVNKDFSDAKVVDATVGAWKEPMEEVTKTKGLPPACEKPGFFAQVGVLMQRQWVLCRRDPLIYTGRAAAFIFGMSFFAIVYVKSREREQIQVLNKLWALLWHVGVPANLAIISVYSYNFESRSIVNEVKNGKGGAWAYCLSNFFFEAPMMVFLAIASCAVSGYGILGWYTGNFIKTILILAATLWSMETMAQWQAVSFANPLLGMMNFMNWWFVSFLFGGVMIGRDQIIWPLKAFTWVTPLTYTLRTLAWLEFHDAEFAMANVTDVAPGWQCDASVPPMQCMGKRGDQVLSSLGQNFSTMSSEDTFLHDFALIMALGAFFKLMFVLGMVIKCRSSATMRSPKFLKSQPSAVTPVN